MIELPEHWTDWLGVIVALWCLACGIAMPFILLAMWLSL